MLRGSPITKLAPDSAPEDRAVLGEPSRVSPPSKARRSTPEEALSPPLPTTLPAEAPKPSRVIAPSEALNRARRASADRRTKLAAAPVPADGAALEVLAEDGGLALPRALAPAPALALAIFPTPSPSQACRRMPSLRPCSPASSSPPTVPAATEPQP